MSIFSEVLAVEVTMRGVDKLTSELDKMKSQFEGLDGVLDDLKGAFAAIGTVAAVAFAGIKEAAADQEVMARLEAFSGSLQAAEKVMATIDQMGAEGVFKKSDIEAAAVILERAMPGALERNINLVKELGARMGSVSEAASFVARLEMGQTSRLMMQLRNAGIGPNALRAAGLNVDGMEIKNSTAEIVRALEKITGSMAAHERLSKTFNAQWTATVDSIYEAVESVGQPFLAPVQALLSVVTALGKAFKFVNDLTGGWMSTLLMTAIVVTNLTKIWSILTKIAVVEKLIAYWAGIRATIQTGGAAMMAIGTIVDFMRKWLTIEKALAAVEATRLVIRMALAALTGNWVGLAAAAAIVGGGAYIAGRALGSAGAAGGQDPARRPQRRDDWENVYKQMYGRAWTG